MGRKHFSKDFKEAMVTKFMNRGDQTLAEVCEQAGIGKSSLGRWISECAMGVGMKNKRSTESGASFFLDEIET